MPTAKKTTAKKPKKNSSHKAKRAVVDEEMWAVVTPLGAVWYVTPNRAYARFDAAGIGGRLARVRITEVTK